jgi:ADP-ribose pyrophosphatase
MSAEGQILPWRVLESELILDNRWAKVRRDSCQIASGLIIPDYFYWEGGDFVQVLALTTTNDVVLTRQYKHGVKEVVLELPAGFIDADDENPLLAAQRELREETGFAGGEWTSLGALNVSSAKATTRAFVFLAQNVSLVGTQKLDPNEEIECSQVSIPEFKKLIASRAIHDSNSIATAFLAFNVLESHAGADH